MNARTFSVDEPGGAVRAAVQVVRALAARDDTEVVLFGHPRVKRHFPGLPLDSTGCIADSQLYGAAWERATLPRRVSLVSIDLLPAPNGNGSVHETPYNTAVIIFSKREIVTHLPVEENGVHVIHNGSAEPCLEAVWAEYGVTGVSAGCGRRGVITRLACRGRTPRWAGIDRV